MLYIQKKVCVEQLEEINNVLFCNTAVPAWRAITCRRFENEVLKTVDFLVKSKENNVRVL